MPRYAQLTIRRRFMFGLRGAGHWGFGRPLVDSRWSWRYAGPGDQVAGDLIKVAGPGGA